MNFRINYNTKQQDLLKQAGFAGLANDPEGLNTLSYLYFIALYLRDHNVNYTKTQRDKINAMWDVLSAIMEGV